MGGAEEEVSEESDLNVTSHTHHRKGVRMTLDPEKEERISKTIDDVVANVVNLPSLTLPPVSVERIQQPHYSHQLQQPTYALTSSSTASSHDSISSLNATLVLPSLGAPNRLRGFEDLPENILENISPTDGDLITIYPDTSETVVVGEGNVSSSPTLASLTPVSFSLLDTSSAQSLPSTSHSHQILSDYGTLGAATHVTVQAMSSSGFTQLAPVTVGGGVRCATQMVTSNNAVVPNSSNKYVLATLKLEPPDPCPSNNSILQASNSNTISHAPATTSSGVTLSGANPDILPSVLLQQNGALHYVKLEVAERNGGGNIKIINQRPLAQQQQIHGVGGGTVELANNLIATMLTPSTSTSQAYTITGTSADGQMLLRPVGATTINVTAENQGVNKAKFISGTNKPSPRKQNAGGVPTNFTNVGEEGEDDIYIDTRDLCKRIAYELKQHCIPQAIFAERVLCRSQGTLSDLLRNPKPWNKLKSGRETFRRMYNWLKQPLNQRLLSLDLWKVGTNSTGTGGIGSGSPQKRKTEEEETLTAIVSPDLSGEEGFGEDSFALMNSPYPANPQGPNGPLPKRPRLVFTDIQKRTLQAIFKETQRPSKEMQQTIAEHLGLDLSTVQNFFMNARRRSRLGPQPDGPAPNQQIRSITPPPRSPPPGQVAMVGRPPKIVRRAGMSDDITPTTARQSQFPPAPGIPMAATETWDRQNSRSLLIENTVARVAEKARQSIEDSNMEEAAPNDPGAPTPPALMNFPDHSMTVEILEDSEGKRRHVQPTHVNKSKPSRSNNTALVDQQGRPVTLYVSNIQSTIPISSRQSDCSTVTKVNTTASTNSEHSYIANQTVDTFTPSSTKSPAVTTHEGRSLPVMSLEARNDTSVPTRPPSGISLGGINSPKKRILLGYGRSLGLGGSNSPAVATISSATASAEQPRLSMNTDVGATVTLSSNQPQSYATRTSTADTAAVITEPIFGVFEEDIPISIRKPVGENQKSGDTPSTPGDTTVTISI